MNLPKFIKDDERLFRLLLGDLFPSLELPMSEYGALQVRIARDRRGEPKAALFLVHHLICVLADVLSMCWIS